MQSMMKWSIKYDPELWNTHLPTRASGMSEKDLLVFFLMVDTYVCDILQSSSSNQAKLVMFGKRAEINSATPFVDGNFITTLIKAFTNRTFIHDFTTKRDTWHTEASFEKSHHSKNRIMWRALSSDSKHTSNRPTPSHLSHLNSHFPPHFFLFSPLSESLIFPLLNNSSYQPWLSTLKINTHTCICVEKIENM